MKYTGVWTHRIAEITEDTTFDNSITIYEGSEIVSPSENIFDGGTIYFGHFFETPTLTAGLSYSGSGDTWDVTVNLEDTLSPSEYAFYSVIMTKDEYEYEVKGGIVYIKEKVNY